MPILTTLENDTSKVPAKVFTDFVEETARVQLLNLTQLPIIHHHVAAMPDVHAGRGSTIGSVIPTKNAIIPAAVGVDIGCGMTARQLSITASDLPESLKPLRRKIEQMVPVGFNWHRDPVAKSSMLKYMKKDFEGTLQSHPKIVSMSKNIEQTWSNQLGTLGGGNHFIEICLDENDQVWIMLHSGSRGVGNIIGRYFIELAKNNMPDQSASTLPDKDLSWLSSNSIYFNDYWNAVKWAQDYALQNRRIMMDLVMDACKSCLPKFHYNKNEDVVECHHNYVAHEKHFGEDVYVTRKGAIRAGEGELGIIPGSMGAKSFIVRGKGNDDSFHSCAHGAGRKMSRTKARKQFTVADLQKQTEGVECRKDKEIIDEIPGAYKDIDVVMKNQSDLVDIVHTLKAVVCVKG